MHGTTVVGYMYCMTGRSAAPGDGLAAAHEAQPPSGLRAAARRLFSRSPPEPVPGADKDDDGDPGAGVTAASAEPAAPESQIPRLLQQTAAWSWRLLLTGLLVYITFRLAVALRLVVLPLIAALLLTALLQPLTARLRRSGFPPLLATWCTFLLAIIVIRSEERRVGKECA